MRLADSHREGTASSSSDGHGWFTVAEVSFVLNELRDRWSREFPPLSVDTPPMAVGLTMTRSLRRDVRPEAAGVTRPIRR